MPKVTEIAIDHTRCDEKPAALTAARARAVGGVNLIQRVGTLDDRPHVSDLVDTESLERAQGK
jgi:hypothetical protein